MICIIQYPVPEINSSESTFSTTLNLLFEVLPLVGAAGVKVGGALIWLWVNSH
jgi:hypothetical protein